MFPLDVNFEREPQYVAGDTSPVMFGSASVRYASFAEVVPQSRWQELAERLEAEKTGLDAMVTRIYNQGREGSCVANACSQAVEIKQCEQFGRARVVPLSAISLYKRIGRSPSSGASISNGLKESQNGILPLDTPENRERFGAHVMPNTGWSTPFPDGWQATAGRFAAVEWTVVQSVEALVSALFCGHPVVVGRSGHSICYVRPVWREGRLAVRYANSWGNWGDAGYGYDSMNMIQSSARWAFALRSVTVSER